jgi:hypothetical protein
MVVLRGGPCLVVALLLSIRAAPTVGAQQLLQRWWGDTQGQGLGTSVAFVGDVNGDGFDDVAAGMPDDDTIGHNSGGVRLLSGADGSVLWTVEGLNADDVLGLSVAGTNDVDGDGVADVVAGAFQVNGRGYAFVLSGVDGSRIYRRNGDSHMDRFGIGCAGFGDIDHDGFGDFAVGASQDDNNGRNDSGSVRVFSGIDGSPLYTIDGPASGIEFGVAMTDVGDVDGDATDDWVGGMTERIRLLSGASGAMLRELKGDPNYPGYFGSAVAATGDLNGDGLGDVVVGAPDSHGTGTAFAVSSADFSILFSWQGEHGSDEFGTSVGGCGDVNGDGVGDVIVGAPGRSTQESYAYLYSGKSGRLLYKFWSDDVVDALGRSVAGAGDLNHDGLADVLLGAPGATRRYGFEGSVSVRAGNDLFLQADPPIARAGDTVALSVRSGEPGGIAAIFLTDIAGTPIFLLITLGVLDSNGEFSVAGQVPAIAADTDFLFRAYAVGPAGAKPLKSSSDELLSIH